MCSVSLFFVSFWYFVQARRIAEKEVTCSVSLLHVSFRYFFKARFLEADCRERTDMSHFVVVFFVSVFFRARFLEADGRERSDMQRFVIPYFISVFFKAWPLGFWRRIAEKDVIRFVSSFYASFR